MEVLFADTAYWIGLVVRRDQLGPSVLSLRSRVETAALVTTEWVMSEFLTFMADGGPNARRRASNLTRGLLLSETARVLPATHGQFLRGLELYEARTDKGYSLVDCVSMSVMRELGITGALTGDRHFEQEGFQVLLR